jgi:hypothetical protein
MKERKAEQAEAMLPSGRETHCISRLNALFHVGRSLEETGQKEAAVHAYERAALIDPGLTFIQEKLAALR